MYIPSNIIENLYLKKMTLGAKKNLELYLKNNKSLTESDILVWYISKLAVNEDGTKFYADDAAIFELEEETSKKLINEIFEMNGYDINKEEK